VAEHGGIARRNSAIVSKRRLEFRKRLDCCVRPETLVPRHDPRLRARAHCYRNNFALKTLLFPRLGSPAMALYRKPILLRSADGALARDVLGRLPHMPIFEGAPQAVMDHG